MTAQVIQMRTGKGRQSVLVEDLRDHRDELAAHNQEALEFVDRAAPLARRLELALEAIAASDETSNPLWRHLHNVAGGLIYELERYERRHLPAPEPTAVAA